MSSQDGSGVPFSTAHEQQSFRLIELPPQLAASLKSSNPPTLYLKSAAANAQSTGGLAPNAVLCTHSQTFQIRQVQSSNSLYILQPSSSAPSTEYGAISVNGISAIAQCNAILEAVPSFISPNNYLRQILPLYGEPAAETNKAPTESKSKEELLKDAPFSQREFEDSLVELCAFEHDGQTYLPSPESQLKTWKAFMNIVDLESLDLTKPFSLPEESEQEAEYIPTLLTAMLEMLKSDEDTGDSHYSIDPQKTIPLIGAFILKASPQVPTSTSTASEGPSGLRLSDLIQQWCDLLPESWRDKAKVEALRIKVTYRDGDMVVLRDSIEEKEIAKGSAVEKGTEGNKGGKGKWHEKFRK
ncbi:MAG: hypothetical protein MMC33_003878 [Icmadophila ericetorum]|nr:hypothetical protein [Icmadophila ericetorum]